MILAANAYLEARSFGDDLGGLYAPLAVLPKGDGQDLAVWVGFVVVRLGFAHAVGIGAGGLVLLNTEGFGVDDLDHRVGVAVGITEAGDAHTNDRDDSFFVWHEGRYGVKA